MKVLLLPLICLVLSSFNPNTSAKKISISGSVTGTRQYCGGARPSDEILTQVATPRPISNKKIYIKQGEVNSFDSKVLLVLTTDSKGNFRAKLRPGKYLIVDSTKKDTSYYNAILKTYKFQGNAYQAVDTACLRKWYLKPECIFNVGNSDQKNISVNFFKGCEDIPCTRLRWPYPQ